MQSAARCSADSFATFASASRSGARGPRGLPILLKDLGAVRFGPDIRRGLLEWNGRRGGGGAGAVVPALPQPRGGAHRPVRARWVSSVWLLWLLDHRRSTAVWGGPHRAHAGLTAQTGIVMIVYIEHAYERRRRAGMLHGLDLAAVTRS